MVLVKVIPQPQMALAGGALLLVAGLTWLAGRLRPLRHEAAGGLSSVAALGVRNASRHTARSVLSVGLIAFAAFTLITVASMRRGEPDDTGDPRSGAGGYRLIAQTSVPLLGDLNTPQGRQQLAVRETATDEKTGQDGALWEGVKFTSLRRWAGQDISCLNLTRPDSPTILGVPHAMVEDAVAQKRFTFAQPSASPDNWRLLEQELAGEDAPVPVIADNETAQYILKMGVGDTMRITDPLGRPRELKLVATLSHSIFQSEMLMSEANFRRLFPAQAGYGVVLAELPAQRVRDVQQALNTELEPYAASVDTTAGRLAMYNRIQDTYLSTFQALGALGLGLGTIGLAVALVRNVIERRPELALLSAIGFRQSDRVKLILSENAFLLVLGLGVGTGCALLGIVPTLITAKEGIALGPLVLTLLAVLMVGLAASVVAVWLSGVRVTPADLRTE
jgi:putative ABC transport system permease protein